MSFNPRITDSCNIACGMRKTIGHEADSDSVMFKDGDRMVDSFNLFRRPRQQMVFNGQAARHKPQERK